MNIDIKTLSQRIRKTMEGIGEKRVKSIAANLITQVKAEASAWVKEIRRIMMTPSSSRGYTNGKLNLHNSESYNQSFPMKITGKLAKSLKYSVRSYKVKYGITISVRRWFDSSMTTNKSGVSYGDVLDEKHPLLAGYKERAYNKLDERLRGLL